MSEKKVFAPLASSNHSKSERQVDDYYATDPRAIDFLFEEEEFSGVIWECACVDEKTEFFDGEKWKFLWDFQKGDKVLVVDEYGNGKFEEPIDFIEAETDLLYKYTSTYLNMALSSGHRVLYKNNHGAMKTRVIDDIVARHEKSKNGFKASIPMSYTYHGTLSVSEWELRLAIATQADGRIRSKTNYVEIRLKKKRKKQRIEYLLAKAEKSYVKKENGEYSNYYFYLDENYKIFPLKWYQLDYQSKNIIVDEVFHWDGGISENRTGSVSKQYYTTVKENADFIQFCINTTGHGSRITVDSRSENRKDCYRVSLINHTYASTYSTGSKRAYEIDTRRQKVYCFKVSTGFFVARREGNVFVTGNCGEGHLSKRMIELGAEVVSTDLIDRGYGETPVDFFSVKTARGSHIVSNPPYKLAQQFCEHGLSLLPEGGKMAMFLKLLFLEGQKRKKFFAQYPPKTIYVSSSRMVCAKNGDFVNAGASAVAYAWFVWEKGYTGAPSIKWIN